MGNFASKFFLHQVEHNAETKSHDLSYSQSTVLQNHDLCTPPILKKTVPVDPRSATMGIPRTPIEVNYTPPMYNKRMASAIPKHLQSKTYLETDFDVIVPPLSPKKCLDPRSPNTDYPRTPILVESSPEASVPTTCIPVITVRHSEYGTPIEELRRKILGLDPRSPAADFDRTPILAPNSLNRIKARSQEKLARRGSYTTDVLRGSRLSYCETTTLDHLPEIHAVSDILESLYIAPATEKALLNKRDSSSSDSSSSIETMSECNENITVIRNTNVNAVTDPIIPKLDSKSSPHDENNYNGEENTPDEIEDALIKTPVDNVLAMAVKTAQNPFKRSEGEGKIKVWRDSMTPEISTDPEIVASGISTSTDEVEQSVPKEEVIIEFEDNTVVKNTRSSPAVKKIAKPEDKPKKEEPSGRKRNVKRDNRIDVDDKKLFTPDRKHKSKAQRNRTPLSNRSNNTGQLQGIPTKSPQQLLRNKATNVYQENTPPHSNRGTAKLKLNATQWDPDSTVII